jgi:hypothetical protein
VKIEGRLTLSGDLSNALKELIILGLYVGITGINFHIRMRFYLFIQKNLEMKILSTTEISVSFFKTAHTLKVSRPKGDVLIVDSHSMSFSLSTPFFIRN